MKNLITFAVALLMLSAPALADISVDLIADGGDTAFDAGDVDISYDGVNLIVTITVDAPWELVETHVHVADSPDAIPNKNGNPQPGKFAYSIKGVDTSHQYTIPYAPTPDTVIAVHAAIEWLEPIAEEPYFILHEETGWAEGQDFSGKNWAMYIAPEWVVSEWNIEGDWTIEFSIGGGTYPHVMNVSLHQAPGDGSFEGSGYYIPNNDYTWDILNGMVVGYDIDFDIDYTGLNPTYYLYMDGTIAGDGSSMSGNCSGSSNGTWVTTSGSAIAVGWTLP